jgi:hypothetical protein
MVQGARPGIVVFVWRVLVEHADALPKALLTSLLQLGIRWLQGREDQDQWSFVSVF